VQPPGPHPHTPCPLSHCTAVASWQHIDNLSTSISTHAPATHTPHLLITYTLAQQSSYSHALVTSYHVINARTHHAGVSRRTVRARPCRGSQARRGRGSHCGDWDQDPSNKLHESSRALRGFSQASWCGLHLPLPGELCYKLLCMWSTCSTRVNSCKRCPAVWALAMQKGSALASEFQQLYQRPASLGHQLARCEHVLACSGTSDWPGFASHACSLGSV
jgi:hypothetical protein